VRAAESDQRVGGKRESDQASRHFKVSV